MDKRITAAEAYLLALRTGAVPATEEAGKHLAENVKLTGATVWGRQGATLEGKKDVLYRITGEWPNTPVYVKGFWSEPKLEGDKVKITGTFPAMGAAPAAMSLTFSYDANGQISQVDQEITPQPRPETTDYIPDAARVLINGALRNNTPMTVCYVDEEGKPNMSLRGSVQVYSPTQLSIWLRNKEGGLPASLKTHPTIGLLYRDSYSRSTLSIQGIGHVEEDPEICERVWNSIQDVEQKHETRDVGCALIIDVKKLQGGTPKGGVRMARD